MIEPRQKHYILTFSNRDLAGSIRLNGVPVFTDNHRNRMDLVLHLNPYVIPDRNELEVVLSVPPDRENLPEAPISIHGKIECIEGTEEENSTDLLLEMNWILDPADQDQNQDFPITLKYRFDAGQAYGPRIWEAATRVSENPAEYPDLFDYIGGLRKAMESRDFNQLLPYLELKHEELSRAFAFPVSELRADDQSLFEKMFVDPDWGILDYDPDNLVIEFWADHRIVSIQRPNGHELLRTPRLGSLDIIFSLPLQLSRLNGQWRLIG